MTKSKKTQRNILDRSGKNTKAVEATSTTEFSVQCELERTERNRANLVVGFRRQVVWLPLTHKGRELKVGDQIKLFKGRNFWRLKAMYTIRPTAEVKQNEDNWRTQRKASDV